eukprot:5243513-Amphidinium_carterae.1
MSGSSYFQELRRLGDRAREGPRKYLGKAREGPGKGLGISKVFTRKGPREILGKAGENYLEK